MGSSLLSQIGQQILTDMACSDQDGQCNRGGLHKSPRGNSLTPASQVSTRINSIEQYCLSSLQADLLSGGNLLNGEWSLHPQTVNQIWKKHRRAAVDPFASRENAKCLLFSHGSNCTVGCGCIGTTVAKGASVRLPPADFSNSRQSFC